jgi:hypothetical protein
LETSTEIGEFLDEGEAGVCCRAEAFDEGADDFLVWDGVLG